MKHQNLATLTGLIVAIVMVVFATNTSHHAAEEESKVLRHVVLFKFKDTATAEQITGIEQAFAGLKSEISQIQDFEWGTDNSPEKLAQGFTHCFLVTFKSEKDRDAYLPHAAHQKFVEKVKPLLDKALVIDYWAKS
jgi:hypothetical protein